MAGVYTVTVLAIVILYLRTCTLRPPRSLPDRDSAAWTAFLFHCAGRGLHVSKWHPFLLSKTSHCCTGSILKNQEDTFAAELHRLKQQPLFSLVDFESVVDWIRSTVAEVSILGRVTTMQAEKLLRFVKDWKKGAL